MKCLPTRKRRADNAPGPLYVDDTCLSCEACWKTAPGIFKSHRVETFAYVDKQPENSAEINLCREVIKLCPVGAIHIDESSMLTTINTLPPKKRHDSDTDD